MERAFLLSKKSGCTLGQKMTTTEFGLEDQRRRMRGVKGGGCANEKNKKKRLEGALLFTEQHSGSGAIV